MKAIFFVVPTLEEVHNARFQSLRAVEAESECHIVTFKSPNGGDSEVEEAHINFFGVMEPHLQSLNIVIIDYQDLGKFGYPLGYALDQLLDLHADRCTFRLLLPVDRQGRVERLLADIPSRPRKRRRVESSLHPLVRFLTLDRLCEHTLVRVDDTIVAPHAFDSVGVPRDSRSQMTAYLHPKTPFAEVTLLPDSLDTAVPADILPSPPLLVPVSPAQDSPPDRALKRRATASGRPSMFQKYPLVFDELAFLVGQLYASGEGHLFDMGYFDRHVSRLMSAHYPESGPSASKASWYTLDRFRKYYSFPRLRPPDRVVT
jgi:hypothetical protein